MNNLAIEVQPEQSDDEALALEMQMLNAARLRAKTRATLRNNENRDFILKHL